MIAPVAKTKSVHVNRIAKHLPAQPAKLKSQPVQRRTMYHELNSRGKTEFYEFDGAPSWLCDLFDFTYDILPDGHEPVRLLHKFKKLRPWLISDAVAIEMGTAMILQMLETIQNTQEHLSGRDDLRDLLTDTIALAKSGYACTFERPWREEEIAAKDEAFKKMDKERERIHRVAEAHMTIAMHDTHIKTPVNEWYVMQAIHGFTCEHRHREYAVIRSCYMLDLFKQGYKDPSARARARIGRENWRLVVSMTRRAISLSREERRQKKGGRMAKAAD